LLIFMLNNNIGTGMRYIDQVTFYVNV
jgi:hypothetical protein